MYDINNFTMRDMTDCGNAIRELGSGAKSMEETSNKIVRYLYDHLIDKETNEKVCAMVRLFKTHPYGELSSDLQEFARGIFKDQAVTPELKCLTLLGTVGLESEWCTREASTGHKAIPLPSEEVVTKLPMIMHLIRQLGLEINSVVNPDPDILTNLEKRTYNVFHVADAVGSPYVVAQEEFVIPYGIKSVLGFGGILPTGDLFVVIIFTKVPINRTTADMFKPLALNVKMAVLPFVKGSVFS